MEISGKGWEILVTRLGVHKRGNRERTYGSYTVFLNGQPVGGLSGNICESPGPGDNAHRDNGKRVEQGGYPLSTQFGKYVTIGYSAGATRPMPGLLLLKTENRDGILIHPGHPPTLFLSSVGCFNPTAPLTATQDMDFPDSRKRVIDLIDSLKAFSPNSFTRKQDTAIPGAAVVVDGEPLGPVPP